MKNPFANSLWLTPDRDIGSASPVIRKTFRADSIPERATLYVTGLGCFEARLNGRKLGNEYFQPVASDYEKRNFTKILYPCHVRFTHRIYPDSVAEYYGSLGHFDTGFLCADILCELLFESGHGEVFEKLLRSEEPGGYLFMKRHGATTIWENWTGGSHCHPMFGASARQLFEGILGIKQEKSSNGWEKIVFNPYLPEKMNFVKGSVMTPRGVISVSLERRNGEVRKNITVPDGR